MVVAIVAAVAVLRESTHGQWRPVEHAEPGGAADRGRVYAFMGNVARRPRLVSFVV